MLIWIQTQTEKSFSINQTHTIFVVSLTIIILFIAGILVYDNERKQKKNK